MEDHSYIDSDGEGERLEARLRLLGTRTPKCSIEGCIESDAFALTGAAPDLLCAEHRADRDGRSWLEQSHTAGQHNLPADAVRIPANDHAVLSDARQPQWPRETLRNPSGSPVRQMAAAMRGWMDVLWLILERTIGWIPTALEHLDTALCEHIGPTWWVTIGWNPRP
jgi:hypothetical protein